MRARGPWIALSCLAACASSDLGATCHLLRPDGTEVSARAGHDLVQSGSGECDDFACASFDGTAAVCTRPCAKAGEACENGFTCQPTLLDPALLARLRAETEGRDEDRDGRDDFEQLAASLTDSLYCAPP